MRKLRNDDIRIATEAAQWLQVLSGGSASERDRAEFVDWAKASPRHLREFLYAEALDTAATQVGKDLPIDSNLDLSQLDDSVVSLRGASEPIRMAWRQPLPWLAAASVALIALAIVWWAGRDALGSKGNYETRIGEQRAVQLADGSVMQLNTDTKIRVRYTKSARGIEILHGEALFKVSRDSARPFSVTAGDSIVRALGTQFNVYHRASATRVAVVEGKVEVSRATSPAGTKGGEPPKGKASRTELARGEAVSIAPDGAIVPQRNLDVAAVTAWQQRRLVFDEESLGRIADEFNRYNTSPRFVIESEELRARRLGGTFDADDPESFLSFVLHQGDLTVQREGDRLIIRQRSP